MDGRGVQTRRLPAQRNLQVRICLCHRTFFGQGRERTFSTDYFALLRAEHVTWYLLKDHFDMRGKQQVRNLFGTQYRQGNARRV
jgi:hypothetical protein